jgi:taurine--2-oxoglutarate transaminase
LKRRPSLVYEASSEVTAVIDLPKIPSTPADLDRYEVDHVFHSWSHQPEVAPPRVVSAQGCRFVTEDGRERLDFSSCFASHNIGHGDRRVVEAIRDQSEELCSFAPTFSTRPRALLARTLAEITPGDLSRSFLTLGGTEAVEAAIKIAHQATGKAKILCRYRAYHGATAAALTLSVGDVRSWAQIRGGTDWVPVPQPYCYRCMFGLEYPSCELRCASFVDEVIELEGGADQIAGMIVEPITGANGVIVPPPDYMPRIREICDRHGILLIADEVMSGFGRTGRWFAVDHWDVVPDVMAVAKGLTAGYVPLGATIARKPVADLFHDRFFNHGATYAGHALACATALRVIGIYEEDGLIENSATLGEYLLDQARALQDRHPCIGEVRGLGLFVGIELVVDRATREPIQPMDARLSKGPTPKQELAEAIAAEDMIAMAANPTNSIALAPPLIATRDDIGDGIARLDRALAVVDRHYTG